MPGAWTTLTVKDGLGTTRPMLAWDESGTGVGPFSFGHVFADSATSLPVMPYASPADFVSGCIATAMTATTSTSLIAAPSSGLRNYITQITVSCSHATQGTDILIQDGAGGATLYVVPAGIAYGGATLAFPTPLRQPTTATAIHAQNVTTGSSTKVSASGYKAA